MHTLAWCHNGYHDRPAPDVIRRARLARVDGLIIKYGDPAFERAITAAAIPWGVERFAYAAQPDREADMLADAVDAGAAWAVANCEPNDGGDWDKPHAPRAIRTLIDAFRLRHPRVPLWICADLRPNRSLNAPFVLEAARTGPSPLTPGITGWMPMVYPKAFGQSVPRAFDAAYPGPTYLGLPCAPVIQTYDAIGPAAVRDQVAEAARRGATSLSIYLLETASDEELRALAAATKPAPNPVPPTPGPQGPAITPELLQATHHAYLRGAIAILDHGTPAELRAWSTLFGGGDK